jgi:hypothetical protein
MEKDEMATQAPNAPQLPLLYNSLEALNSGQHAKMKLRKDVKLDHVGTTHAIPVTVEEFVFVQRFYPIIFSAGDMPVPLALLGLNEGVNTYFDGEGKPLEKDIYVPAYLRRYPFMLAKLQASSDELSLCFDPTSEPMSEDGDGPALFDGDQPSETTRNILGFCEQFEQAGQRTQSFMDDLLKSGLLMDGEVAIQPDGAEQPFLYRGFRMVDEEKLRELRGDELRKMNQSGILPAVYAHLFSLSQIREIFARQVKQGKGPAGTKLPETAEA